MSEPIENGQGLPEAVRRKLVETAELPTKGLTKANEGDCQLSVGIDTRGRVILEFGKAVRFVALPPEQALALGASIRNMAVKASGSVLTSGLGLQRPPR